MPVFKGTRMPGLEMQHRVLEKTTKRKTEAEATRARGDSTSTQGVGTLAQIVGILRGKVVPSVTQPQ